MLKVADPLIADSICAILSRLHRKGGCTTLTSKSSMQQIGITNFDDEAAIESSTWRSLGRMLRNNGHANPPLEAVSSSTRPKYETIFAKGIPRLCLIGAVSETSAIKKPKLEPDSHSDLSWSTWLHSEHKDVKKVATGDQLATGCMLAIHPSVKCYVATESAVINALREAVEGRSSALFSYNGSRKVWEISKVDGRLVTVEGFTPDSVNDICNDILHIAQLQTTVMTVCEKGILCSESPTLSLFSTTLQAELYEWRKQVRNPFMHLNLLSLKRSLRSMSKNLIAAAALIQPDETFPSGSILLQNLYRRLTVADSNGDTDSAALYLKLLNVTLQPLMQSIASFMHGNEPGIHLQTDGKLIWEGIRIPEFLRRYEVAISSSGCSVSDVKNIIPDHSVLLMTAGDPKASQAPLPEHCGVLGRKKGAVSLLQKIVNKSRTNLDPGHIAPLLLGIRVTVKGTVEVASSLDAVSESRKSAAQERQHRLAIREKAAQLRQKQALKELNQRRVIPDEWPGSLSYQKMQREREEQKKRNATKAHYESLGHEVEMKNANNENNEPPSPLGEDNRFRHSEIERVANIVKMEYEIKMRALDQRITELGGISRKQHWMNKRRALNTKRIALLMKDVWSETPSPPIEKMDIDDDTVNDNNEGDDDSVDEPIPSPSLSQSVVSTTGVSDKPLVRSRSTEAETKSRIFGDPIPDNQPRVTRRYRAKRYTEPMSNNDRKALFDDLKPRVGDGPKRKRVIWTGTQGRRAKQRCIPYHNIPIAVGCMKVIPDFMKLKVKDHIETDDSQLFQEYEDPTYPEDTTYAAARAKTLLRHSIPNQSVSVSPPRLVRLAVPDSIRQQPNRDSDGFDTVQQLKQLYAKITSRQSTASPLRGNRAPSISESTKIPQQVVNTLTSSLKGNPPVYPEELAPVYLNCELPVDVGLKCTIGRAISSQQVQVTTAVQNVILTAGRLKDHLAILQSVYLALDSLLSAEISRIIDSVASGTSTITSAKSNIQLALRRVRTSLAFPGTKEGDCSDFASCFSISIFDDILPSGTRFTRSEFAEDYVQITYLPTDRIKHIITEPHLRVYKNAHRMLLALRSSIKVSTAVLRSCRATHRGSAFGGLAGLSFLRYEIQRLLQGLSTYMCDGLRAASIELRNILMGNGKNIPQPSNMVGYRDLHEMFVAGVQRVTLTTPSMKPVNRRLREVIQLSLSLPSLIYQPSATAVQRLHHQFRQSRQFIIDALVAESQAPSTKDPTAMKLTSLWPDNRSMATQMLAYIHPAAVAKTEM
eukprot:TRINITY_DN11273_c1_g1_i1.p1 TRINITY_DN11273_c1_g1~~TRINITY_DN11273_c1_g1_i1.p1  ORF type:complete len:1318 (+),score=276.89 TRINITY_DN11273_c1_g1_i1:137-3955(+)